jgi:hypothetical protein
MKDNTKSSKVGLIISVFTIIIALTTFVYARIKGMPSWTEGIILVSVIIIFCSNILNYKSHKNKDNNSKKNYNCYIVQRDRKINTKVALPPWCHP